MSNMALIWMIVVQSVVTIITVYLIYKIMRSKNKSVKK